MPPPSFIRVVVIAVVVVTAYAAPGAAQGEPPSPSPSAAPPVASPPAESPSPSPVPSATPSPALPAAGVVPPEVTVELGGVVSPAFALARVRAALVAAAQLAPGAGLTFSDVVVRNVLREGDSLESLARVTIAPGAGYTGIAGTTAVHLRVESLGQLEPAFLFYSDDPEKLDATSDGVLYENTIDPARPARVYAYHVSQTPARRLFLALQTAAGSARVQILGYAAGPTDAFAYVGHVSTLQYLLERSTQESAVVAVTADSPYLQQLGYRAMNAGELIAAIFDVRVLDGGPVRVEIVDVAGDADPLGLLGGSEVPGDGHGRRGEFALGAVAPIAMSYVADDVEPSPFPVGVPTIANLRPGGRPLGGDYGALRPVTLALSNPGGVPASVYFYEQAGGGSATTTIWFAGDPRPIEVPCIHDPANRYTVKSFDLAAGESRTVNGEYMTDGTSSFPLFFGLTSTPPSPPPGPYSPDACNPRTPPPAPPSPAASGEASALPASAPSPSASPAT